MKNEILEITFIVFLMVIGLLVIIDDVQYKKIKNKFILLGFIGGSALFLVGFLFGFVQIVYLRDVLINLFIALIVSYLFWLTSFWPAGDAKLFSLFSFLLPLHFYWKSYLPFFPSIMLLANIFIFVYLFLFVRSLLHIIILLYQKDKFLFDFFNRLKTVFFSSNFEIFFKKINFLIIIKNIFLVAGMFILMNYILSLNQIGSSISIKTSFFGMFVWLTASLIIKKYIADKGSYIEKIENLKIGSSLLITSSEADFFTKEFLRELGALKAEGLDQRQVEIIKRELRAKKLDFTRIQRDEPFSPWILAGLLATMLLNDNIIQFFGGFFTQGH